MLIIIPHKGTMWNFFQIAESHYDIPQYDIQKTIGKSIKWIIYFSPVLLKIFVDRKAT